MRLRGILTSLLLALTLLAPTTSAGGDPPDPHPQCIGARTTGPIEAVVAAEVEQYGCETTVVLLWGADCTGTPAEGRVHVSSGILTVVVPHCGAPAPTASAASAASVVCPETVVSAGLAGEVGVDDACKLHAHLLDTSQLCNFMPGVYPTRHDVVDNDAAHVSHGACGFLHADAPDPTAAAWLPVCPDHRVGLGAAGEAGYVACEAYVHLVDDVVCTKLGFTPRENTVVDEGRVRVTYTTCTYRPYEPAAQSTDAVPPLASAAAAPTTGPCNGVYYFEESVGPVTIWFAGLGCTGVRVDDAPLATGGPCDRIHGPVTSQQLTWTIDDRCRHDVYVDVIECPNEAQWTKTNEVYEAHPNLTLHYTFCRLG